MTNRKICVIIIVSIDNKVVTKAMIDTIITEMAKGNFSFAILVVGILQLIVMIRTSRKKDNKKER